MTTDIFSVFSKDQVLTPADGKAYEESLHRWADNAVRRAKFVVFPRDAQEVGKAIRYAVDNDLELAIKGGGHSTSGASSSEGLVIDLKHLNTVSIDTEKRLISVEGGCVWADVDREAAKYGLATVGGTVNHTGVGGLTVGGGYGWLTAKYGLTIDNLVEAEVVLANGSVVTCSETENSDLFWGIRGAGSNFGPVTKFVLKGYPQPNKVWSGMVVYHPSKLAEVVDAAREWLGRVGEDESAMIIFAQHAGNPVVVLSPFYNGPAEEGRQKFAKFLAIEHIADQTQERPYEEQNSLQNRMTTHGDRKVLRAAPFVTLDTELSKHVFAEFVKMTAAEPDFKASAVIIELHPHHKISKVPVNATAFANRGPYFSWTFITRFTNPALDDTARAWSKAIAQHIRITDAKLSGLDLDGTRGYSNYGLDDESVQSVFGENYGRLTELKAKYDPGMVFRKWLPIVPKGGKAAA